MAKMKIKLGTLLSANPKFVVALDKLGEDPGVSMRDRYAIGKTRRDVIAHIEDYEEQRYKLVKSIGKPERALLTVKLEKLKSEPALANSPEMQASVAAIGARLAAIPQTAESYRVDDEDVAAVEQYHAKLKELQATEVEIYLDHRIQLQEGTRLTSKEMMALDDIIELPPDLKLVEAKGKE